MDIQKLVREIQKQPHKQPMLIAIEGFGGSGKTTLAETLCSILDNAYVIHMDDFIVKEKLAEPSWDSGVFDRNRLKKQVLIPASQSAPIEYQSLNWDTNTLSNPVRLPANIDFLIVEGISAYHPDIGDFYDYKVWVDTPVELAKERGHGRDGSNENASMWDLWTENDLVYQQHYHPEKVADYIYSNL